MSAWTNSLESAHQQRQKSRSYTEAIDSNSEDSPRKVLGNMTNGSKEVKDKKTKAGIKRWLSFSRKHKGIPSEDTENSGPSNSNTSSGRRSLLKRSKSIGSGDVAKEKFFVNPDRKEKDTSANLFGMDVTGMQKEQIEMLRKFVISLGEENHRLKTEKPQLIHENDELMTENEQLRHKLKVLETQISVFDDRIHELRSKNHQLEHDVDVLKDELNAPAFV